MGDEHTTAAATEPVPVPVGAGHDEPTATEAPPPSPAATPAPAPAASSEDVVDDLAARAAERDEYLALAQRTRADFENYRKRVARDAAAAELRAVGRLVRELLPAIDNLERALAAAGAEQPNGDGGQLVNGMRLVRDDLRGALARAGVESFTSQGERFDPELHEAIAQRPQDGAEPGTVVEVYQEGYRLNDSLIRPARVVVAGAPAAAAAPPPPPPPAVATDAGDGST